MALSLRNSPRDFHEGKPLTPQCIMEENVDDHHIFPQAYLGSSAEKSLVDCVLNRTLIDRITNIRISAKAPSTYLSEMSEALSPTLLSQILESHGLSKEPSGPLFNDDFAGFLQERARTVRLLLSNATGWSHDATSGMTDDDPGLPLVESAPDLGPLFRADGEPGRIG